MKEMTGWFSTVMLLWQAAIRDVRSVSVWWGANLARVFVTLLTVHGHHSVDAFPCALRALSLLSPLSPWTRSPPMGPWRIKSPDECPGRCDGIVRLLTIFSPSSASRAHPLQLPAPRTRQRADTSLLAEVVFRAYMARASDSITIAKSDRSR